MYKNLKVIAFDADDTLWVNEPYFREAEHEFAQLLASFETENKINQELLKVELRNLELYGYGVKGFVLSMMESALELSNNSITPNEVGKILEIGKAMLKKPIELLNGVEEVLKTLSPKYRLIVATKGDLLDQERKLEKSGLLSYFDHIEVLSEKKQVNYKRLIDFLDVKPSEFLMIGNSLKSDILPLVALNSNAIHVPYHTTWAHEEVKRSDLVNKNYKTVNNLTEILDFL
ncbi:HAD family hydrolase [Urechidicola vernalis]|uniref:HAD family hydrolase n=1 Tax=Urechidicola vernalis TaxID=3075600 RepID=A0ABU2Y238_9FLAO|nr:HAD family hydrolase [Urechidicola sp. P050]MDT0551762.1 HAD family hydrolase [Urechidicola sp. P050]